jgi:hypothetical protein
MISCVVPPFWAQKIWCWTELSYDLDVPGLSTPTLYLDDRDEKRTYKEVLICSQRMFRTRRDDKYLPNRQIKFPIFQYTKTGSFDTVEEFIVLRMFVQGYVLISINVIDINNNVSFDGLEIHVDVLLPLPEGRTL